MMKSPITEVDGYKIVDSTCAKMLESNGTYLPLVKRVIFNLKTEERIPVLDKDGKQKVKDGKPLYDIKKLANPILSTTVFWSDGTTTRVKNTTHDIVTTTEKTLSDGSKVVVADQTSKERAIVYATVKRTCGHPDEKGEIVDTALGRILNDIVESAYDQNYEEAKAKLDKISKKTAYAELKSKSGKSKTKRYSYAECLQMIGPIIEAVSKNPNIIEKLMTCFNNTDSNTSTTKKSKKGA